MFSSVFVSSLLCHFAFEGYSQRFGKEGIQVHEMEKLDTSWQNQICADPLGINTLTFSFRVRK
jgi:hypothetical protein